MEKENKNKVDLKEALLSKEDFLDVFEQAASDSLSENNISNVMASSLKPKFIKPKKETEKINFKKLEKKIDNEYAEKFNEILESLPDREFVRVYLKVLEFFKPKIVRGKGESGEETQTTINVLIKK